MRKTYLYDYRKLKARIIEKVGTNKVLADLIGITETSLSLKMNSRNYFMARDISRICEVLDIPVNEIGEYFFKTVE